ncbi:hypothetical protein JCM8547_006295 [Rhodosporidiobolus lusitaniae]
MAKTKPGFYAVRVGRKPGVYTSWDEAKAQVDGFVAARHKKFPTRQEAEAFVSGGGGTPQSQPSVASMVGSTSNANGTGKVGDEGPPAKRQKTSSSVYVKQPKGRTVYCDGSSRGNGKVGAVAGIGIFWSHEVGANNLSERLPGPLQTNNRAEMYAIARILETDPTPHLPLTICSDSQYTIDVFSKWIPGWISKNWKTSDGKVVANQDLIRYVLSLLALRTAAPPPSSLNSSKPSSSNTSNITFHKVKAHVGIDGNEQADKFANAGAFRPVVADAPDFEKLTRENEEKLKKLKTPVQKVEDVKYEVEIEKGDLLDEDELRELEKEQNF